MPNKYIDHYDYFTNYSSRCTSCGGDQWKSASLIHKEGKGKLSKLCEPPTKPFKPIKLPPRIIGAPLSVIFVLFALVPFGKFLIQGLPKMANYHFGISPENPILYLAIIIAVCFLVVGAFEILKAGFTDHISDNVYKEKLQKDALQKYERQVRIYPQLRVCMRCGEHYLGK